MFGSVSGQTNTLAMLKRKTLCSLGFAKSHKQILANIQSVVQKDINVTVTNGWWDSFRKRHPSLCLRNPKQFPMLNKPIQTNVIICLFLDIYCVLFTFTGYSLTFYSFKVMHCASVYIVFSLCCSSSYPPSHTSSVDFCKSLLPKLSLLAYMPWQIHILILFDCT